MTPSPHPSTVDAYERRVLAALVAQAVTFPRSPVTAEELHSRFRRPSFNVNQTTTLLGWLVDKGQAAVLTQWDDILGVDVPAYIVTTQGATDILVEL